MKMDITNPRLDALYRAFDNYRQMVNDVDEIISDYTDSVMACKVF